MRHFIVVGLLCLSSAPATAQQLFTDSPGNPARRTAIAKNIKDATADEKRALLAAIRGCVPNDQNVYKDEAAAVQYHRTCKSGMDTWRIYFGRTNPPRVIDQEVTEFLGPVYKVIDAGIEP